MARYTKATLIEDLIIALNEKRKKQNLPPVRRGWTGVKHWLMTDEKEYKAIGRMFNDDEFIGFLEGLLAQEGTKPAPAETSISNDSLEWRVRDNEIIDNKSKIAWCKDVPTANHILEAVNNYNALKDALKQIYTLAEDMGMMLTSEQYNEAFRAKFNPIMTNVEILLNSSKQL